MKNLAMENKKTILVVEDDTPLRNALCDKFGREGFAVLEAKNGEEALGVALDEHPDLIMLDIIMPVMDGMTMLKKLREDYWGNNVPVIILTNLSSDHEAVEAFKNLAYDFIVKSNYKINDLVKIIKEKLDI